MSGTDGRPVRTPRQRRRPRGHRQLLATRHLRSLAPPTRTISWAHSPSCVSSKPSPSTTPSKPRLYLVTANAQPAPGTRLTCGRPGRHLGARPSHRSPGILRTLGRPDRHRHGHRYSSRPRTDRCAHLRAPSRRRRRRSDRDPRRAATFVPRLRPCDGLTKPFPTKLTPDATYVVTGGAGALGRVVADLSRRTRSAAHHLAEPKRHPTQRPLADAGRRRSALRDRRHDPGDRTPRCPITTASVDVADVEQVTRLAARPRTGRRQDRSAESSTPQDRSTTNCS